MSKSIGFLRDWDRILFAILMLTSPVLAFSQASNPLSFEVASIKPAETITAEMIMAGKMHAGLAIDGARVDIGYVSLADLIPLAFKVKAHQVAGPDWLKGGQRFDILGKLPEGTNKDQVPEMLQSLLTERFLLKFHRETRELPIYALVVSKSGHKLKESPPDPEILAVAPSSTAKVMTLNAGDQKVQISPSTNGATVTVPGSGTIKISMDPETQQMRMEYGKLSMAQFAELLTRLMDRPVFDRTELKGNFQVALSLTLDNLMLIARSSGINIPLPPGGPAGTASDPTGGASVFSSVQQLGLRLESQKESIEFVVIDHLEKMPTEN